MSCIKLISHNIIIFLSCDYRAPFTLSTNGSAQTSYLPRASSLLLYPSYCTINWKLHTRDLRAYEEWTRPFMRGVRGWISGMMVSRVSLQALSKRLPCSNLLPYYFASRTSEGVASYPIHVPPRSATAQVNIMCIFNNMDC